MIDSKKVIDGLKCCSDDLIPCFDCPYVTQNKQMVCTTQLTRDALALLNATLKEQNKSIKRLIEAARNLSDALEEYEDD